ncbi:hypothetical protein CFP56_001693 [Quercus suber]|uniref:Core-2/I-branching beta-1,6-N-acetylglucosaminyltransferase family protein n=1 Tax=Quercus suber TaxID=58331 RepID=A0AAW0IMH1_QUESU
MSRKRASPPIRHSWRFFSNLIIFLCVFLCLFAFVRLHFQSSISTSPSYSTLHDHDDHHFEGPPKIAFLFLVRKDLPLDFLWGAFFKNGDAANLSIYIHSEPRFVFDETTTSSAFFYGRQLTNSIQVVWGESSMIMAERLLLEKALEDPANQRFILLSDSCIPLYEFSYIYNAVMSSPKSFNGDAANLSIYIHSEPRFVFDETTTSSAFFYGRQLTNSIQVVWGESSMIMAERLLLEKALEDPANQRFILLSDSCIPLYEFSYIYNAVMSSPKSFVDSFININEDRYDPKMSPAIPEEKWRKGSQELGFRFMFPWLTSLQNPHNCIPDEHYVPTLLAMSGLEDELERRSLTYTLWNHSAVRNDTKSWHPITFDRDDASPQEIKKIKDINHVYYESENRTAQCTINSKLTPCFLFARKFTYGAAIRVLTMGLVGPYDFLALSKATASKRKSKQYT